MAEDQSASADGSAAAQSTAPLDPLKRIFNFNTALALLIIVFSIVLYFYIIPTQIDKPRLVIGRNPLDADMFPQVMAITLFIIGLIYLLVSFRIRETNGFKSLDREAITNVMVTIIACAIYSFILVGNDTGHHIGVDFGDLKIGFVVPSVILIFVLSLFYGNANWWLAAIVSVVVPVFIYLVFTRYLLQSLPESPETEWLYHNAVKPIVDAIKAMIN